MRQAIALLVVTILVSGCATGYHRQGFTGGYTDMKLQDDIFKIGFRGNAYCGSNKAENLALLRCAEVTLNNGYKYFVIIEGKSGVETSLYTTPATAQTYGTSYGGVYQGTTTVSGGQTYTYHKPGASYTIKCFKEKPENTSTIVYDAEQIKNNIKARYNLR